MLLYNYEHPTDNPEIDFENDLYNKFINKERRKLHISLSGLPYEKAYYREYSINRYHGNPYDRWVLMGKPETQLFHKGIDVVSNVLKASSLPDYKENTINIYNNILNLEFNLDPLEIKGIDIFLK
jgi:xylan 1,4-beta-xylosidase